MLGQRRHVFLAYHWVFVVFEQAFQLLGAAQAGFQRPGGVRVDPQRHVWPKRLAHQADRAHFFVGLKHAGLDFDRLKAECVDHRPGLLDNPLGAERFALAGGRPSAGGSGVVLKAPRSARAGVLVEQVGAEGHALAHLAAQQIAYRAVRRLANHIEAGNLDCAKGARWRTKLALPGLVGAIATRITPDRIFQRGKLPGVAADHQIAHGLQVVHYGRAAVRFAYAGGAVVGHQLDNRAQGVGRVQAKGRAQRWVAKGDRRHAIFYNLHRVSYIKKG